MSIDLIKKVREKTGLSFKDIKKVVDAMGDGASVEGVIEELKKQGAMKHQSRQDRATGQGGLFSYVHEGRVGAMLEVKCETDFVARSADFKEMGNNIALHIAAYQPNFIKPEEVDQNFLNKELEIAREQLIQEGKPENIIDNILKGKKDKIVGEVSLLSQPYLKDPKITVKDYISQIVQKTGENIVVTKFVTYVLGN